MDHLPAPKRRRISEDTQNAKDCDGGKSSRAAGEARRPVRSRRKGKLAILMHITVDVFFEVVTHLRPIDLLQLSRVSKHFRATFLRRSARMLWITARRKADILPLPAPLPGMSEPRFAAFMFEENCTGRGASSTQFQGLLSNPAEMTQRRGRWSIKREQTFSSRRMHMEELRWHVEAKHLKEFSTDDVVFN